MGAWWSPSPQQQRVGAWWSPSLQQQRVGAWGAPDLTHLRAESSPTLPSCGTYCNTLSMQSGGGPPQRAEHLNFSSSSHDWHRREVYSASTGVSPAVYNSGTAPSACRARGRQQLITRLASEGGLLRQHSDSGPEHTPFSRGVCSPTLSGQQLWFPNHRRFATHKSSWW